MTYQKVSASGLIINNNGQFLVLKRAENDDFLPGVFGLPGGGTEYNEHPAEGLKREIFEECGLSVNVHHPLTAFSFEMPHEGVKKHTVEIVYLCTLDDNSGSIQLSFEHCDYKWVRFHELDNLTITPIMKELLSNLTTHPLLSYHAAPLTA